MKNYDLTETASTSAGAMRIDHDVKIVSTPPAVRETSALKAAIEEFGIVNPKYQKPLFVRRAPGDDE
jgi:hypothetical protein